jgi:tellurite resistance protein TerC
VTPGYHGRRFFVVEAGKRYATPLFLVLLVIEATDVVFAVDSIPAIFGITRDPFLVFTSNIFAILGLRALYFLLADFMGRFHYLKYGLGLVLAFVGVKMVGSAWFKVPIGLSLGVIATLLGGSVVASWLFPPNGEPGAPTSDQK